MNFVGKSVLTIINPYFIGKMICFALMMFNCFLEGRKCKPTKTKTNSKHCGIYTFKFPDMPNNIPCFPKNNFSSIYPLFLYSKTSKKRRKRKNSNKGYITLPMSEKESLVTGIQLDTINQR